MTVLVRCLISLEFLYISSAIKGHTLPTAASPSNTSLTLLLGFGAGGCAESAMAGGEGEEGRLARRLRPTL